jgi:hypothetical protein
MEAKRPLVIVGKGAAFGRAEVPIRKLIQERNLPFLATPMGKGKRSKEIVCAIRLPVISIFPNIVQNIVGVWEGWLTFFPKVSK